MSHAAPQPSAMAPMSRTAHVLESLRWQILNGTLHAGQSLVEAELARTFNVSKTPVREALKTLAGLGLVTMSEYRGAVVRSVDYEMARAVFEIRLLLEPQAVAMAVAAGSIDIDAARATLARASDAADDAERSLINREFHRLTFAGCGNPLLVTMLDDLRDQTALITVNAWRYGITWIHEAHEHEAILDAIESGDADRARELNEAHIRSFTDHVVTRLKEHDE